MNIETTLATFKKETKPMSLGSKIFMAVFGAVSLLFFCGFFHNGVTEDFKLLAPAVFFGVLTYVCGDALWTNRKEEKYCSEVYNSLEGSEHISLDTAIVRMARVAKCAFDCTGRTSQIFILTAIKVDFQKMMGVQYVNEILLIMAAYMDGEYLSELNSICRARNAVFKKDNNGRYSIRIKELLRIN